MPTSTQIEGSKLGVPGVPGVLIVVPRFLGDPRTEASRMHDNSVRKFKVSALLSKLKPLGDTHINGDFTEKDGASYLSLPVGAVGLKVVTLSGQFEVKINEVNEWSLIEITVNTISVQMARKLFLEAISPFIDSISYRANCPIWISRIRFEDEKNSVTTIEYIAPYPQSIINDHGRKVYQHLHPIYALYREAKNADSYFYRVLCYYKIMEGLLNKLRSDVHRSAKKHKIILNTFKDLVPYSVEYLPDQAKLVGKPIRTFFDEILRPEYRIAVAHFITENSSALNTSSAVEIGRFSSVILMSDLCARALIDAHERLLEQLPDDLF